MMIGIYGLFFEFTSPGFGVPGVAGAISLLIALYAFQLLPVNWAGVLLLAVGAGLMLAEAFLPSFGVLGVGGIIAFVVGGLFLMDADVPGFGIPIALIVGMALASAAVIIVIASFAARSLRRPVVSGREEMLGVLGVVERATDDGDWWIAVHGEHWRARSAQVLVPGDRVRVAGIDGLALTVVPIAAQSHTSAAAPGSVPAGHSPPDPTEPPIMIDLQFGLAPLFLLLIFLVVASIKILREYERGVIFLLGRFWKVKGPGLVIVIPGIQQMVKVDLRVVTMDVPSQDVISRDNVSVKVNAIVFFRVVDPEKAIIQVENFLMATSQLAQTTLRAVLGKHELDEMLAERERLNLDVQQILDAQTDSWGIKVANVEIKHIDLNESMVRAIARQAEAERERRAKVIHAEGEKQAAQSLLEAAQMLSREPAAMQLRYLQTLTQVAGDKSSTLVFPVPVDLLGKLMRQDGGHARE